MRHKNPVPLTTSQTQEPVKVLVQSKNPKNPTKLKAKPKKLEDGTTEMITRSWLSCPICHIVVELTAELGQAVGNAIKSLDEKEAKKKAKEDTVELVDSDGKPLKQALSEKPTTP